MLALRGQEVQVLAVIVYWWLAVSVAGWVCWPLLAWVFGSLPDRGWALSKAFGLLLWAYVYWLLGHLGLELSNPLIWWGVAALVAMLGLWGWARQQHDLMAVMREEGGQMLAAEILFAALFALGVAYRAFDPAIYQAEQPVGLAFLSSLLRNPGMPPADPWMAGMPIAYPYWGYLLVALPARAVGATAPVAYNLALAQGLALTGLASYGLIYNLLRVGIHWRQRGAQRISTLGGTAVALLGNWEGFFEYVRVRGVGPERLFRWLDISGLSQAPITGGYLPEGSIWWWRATRVLYDRTLGGGVVVLPTEFPAFSLLLGELTPRFLALPFLALALAIALEALEASDELLHRWWRRPRFWAMAWILGALAPLDPWCGPVAVGIVLVCCVLGSQRSADAIVHVVSQQASFARWMRRLANGLGAALALTAGAVLLYLPYYVTSLGDWGVWELAHDANTSIQHYAIVLGPWMIPLLGDALMAYERMRQGTRPVRRMKLVYLALILLALLVAGGWIIGGWAQAALRVYLAVTGGPWLILAQIGLVTLLFASAVRGPGSGEAGFDNGRTLARLLLAAGVGLTLIAEFYYLPRGQDSRAETVAQLYYQAWLLLGIGAVTALARLWHGGGRWRSLAMLGVVLLGLGLYYPAAAAYTKADRFGATPTLDGAAYLETEEPGAHVVYRWLDDRAMAGEVVVEAPGVSLDASTSRMASLTGVPTILGWADHEARWRGQEAVRQRLVDLDTIYRSREEAEVLAALAHYGARYLYVGPGEIARYRLTETKLAWWGTFLEPVLQAGEHRLYRVP